MPHSLRKVQSGQQLQTKAPQCLMGGGKCFMAGPSVVPWNACFAARITFLRSAHPTVPCLILGASLDGRRQLMSWLDQGQLLQHKLQQSMGMSAKLAYRWPAFRPTCT